MNDDVIRDDFEKISKLDISGLDEIAALNQPEPIPAGVNGGGHDKTTGRFTKGNRLGNGNPMNRKAQKLRAALLRCVTVKDIQELTRHLLAQARGGDVMAAKLILDRTLGRCPLSLELTDDGNDETIKIIRIPLRVPDDVGKTGQGEQAGGKETEAAV